MASSAPRVFAIPSISNDTEYDSMAGDPPPPYTARNNDMAASQCQDDVYAEMNQIMDTNAHIYLALHPSQVNSPPPYSLGQQSMFTSHAFAFAPSNSEVEPGHMNGMRIYFRDEKTISWAALAKAVVTTFAIILAVFGICFCTSLWARNEITVQKSIVELDEASSRLDGLYINIVKLNAEYSMETMKHVSTLETAFTNLADLHGLNGSMSSAHGTVIRVTLSSSIYYQFNDILLETMACTTTGTCTPFTPNKFEVSGNLTTAVTAIAKIHRIMNEYENSLYGINEEAAVTTQKVDALRMKNGTARGGVDDNGGEM